MPQLKVGDEEAWNSLCDKFRVGLDHRARKFISDSKMTSALNADDLVQESLLKAWNQIGKFKGATTAQFAAWLFTIIRNTFLKCSDISIATLCSAIARIKSDRI